MYAIFACQKNKNRSVDPPCLDPLSYGRDGEPEPHLLLRRGRVSVFEDKEAAQAAMEATVIGLRELKAFDWLVQFDFVLLECDLRFDY